MKRYFLPLALLPLAAHAQYLDGLPPAASVSPSDIVPVCQGGTPGHPGTCATRGATASQFESGIAVTSVTAGTGLTGGGSGGPVTLNIGNTAVTPGSYTAPTLTVNAQGQITGATSQTYGTIASVTAGSGLTGGGSTGALTISLASIAGNSILGNATAVSAPPTTLAMPSCSGGANALTYTTNSGFGCNVITGGSATVITIGSTTVGSGTAGNILYDNAGSLGQLTVSGSGSVAMTTAPTISNITLTGTTAAPTPATGDATTKVATAQFVANTFAIPPAFGSTTPGAVHATTISATGAITPSQTAGIVGTTTNNNASAGSVGEYISSTILAGSAVPLTNNIESNVTSISLTAGDWDVWGNVAYAAGSGTVTTICQAWTSTTSATVPTAPNNGGYSVWVGSFTNGAPLLSAGMQRISVSGTTTVFLSASSAFSVSTMSAYGFIAARRVR